MSAQAAATIMSSSAPSPARRPFRDEDADPAEAARQQFLLQVFLSQDGSTTRICRAIAGAPLNLQVLRQGVTSEVPDVVRAFLPGTRFIERVSTLAARGEIMMDNLVYVALDGLPEPVRAALDSGAVPIGQLLESLWVRRVPLRADWAQGLCERLWKEVGMSDPAASRAYTIATPEGQLFVIAETFRRGMRMEPLAPAYPEEPESESG